MRTERFRGALLSALVIASLMVPAISLLFTGLSSAAPELTPRAPIYIYGNAGFTPENGVNGGGSGTENDPYIIENWDISVENVHGIWIKNTTAYFVIRNSYVHDGWENYYAIYFDNVINGKIDNVIIENNERGIYLENSTNNHIYNNTCENNDLLGIRLYYSDNNFISNNLVENNYWGILIHNSSNNLVSNNTLGNNEDWGIWLGHSDNNLVSNNICENSGSGIYIGGDNNFIDNNLAGNNDWYGIHLGDSSYNTISNNTCENNYLGIFLGFSTDNNIITGCTSENNHLGIYLWYDSNSNHIYHNSFRNNENQAYDNGSNYWDNGYPWGGNYWSDYTGEDNYQGENQDIPGSDEIGDTPYDVLGDSNQDRYPLMEPWPWITSITVLPSSTDIEVGETENFYAIATYSDGENEIVTHDADWTVNPAFGGSFIFAVILGYPYEIARFTLENKDFNVTVTASYMGYSDNALVFPWHASTVTFRLENLYAVHFATTFRLLHGSKIVVKFYTYGDGYENEKVIETFSPPWIVTENESIRHPDDIGVKKARVDLTYDNTENVIWTVASFTVTKLDLEARFLEIPFYWSQAGPAGKLELETEFLEIPFYWSGAPD